MVRGGETGAPVVFRWRKPVVIALAVIGVVLVAILVWLGSRVLVVRGELVRAQDAVAAVRSGGDVGDNLQVLATSGAAASRAASDPVWAVAEHLPVVGDNLLAVRLSANSLDALANDVALPVLAGVKGGQGGGGSGLSGLIAPLQAAAPRVTALTAELDAVPTASLVSQVRSGLAQVRSVMKLAEPAVRLLPGLLGADGAKNYLVAAENNAELMPLGGSAGTGTLIRVDHGRLTIIKHAVTQDYDYVRPLPDAFPKNLQLLYGPVMKTHPNATVSRPDWPTAAVLTKELWNRDISSDRIDGVASIDPIALSYVLRATGPVTLSDGETLTADNIVKVALSDAYTKYGDSSDHANGYFREMADAVFQRVAGGDVDPGAMLGAVRQAIANRSLMFWSADPDVQQVVAKTGLAGVLPTSNKKSTSIGVFFRDHSFATKIDYYLQPATSVVTECRADGTTAYTITVNLTLEISRKAEAKLPRYVRGHLPGQRYDTEVFIYGPRKGHVESVQPLANAVVNRTGVKDLGRRVMKVTVSTTPGGSGSFVVTYTIPPGTGQLGPTEVLTTPTVRAAELGLSGQACQVAR